MQEITARATMDVILAAGGFGMDLHALQFGNCEPLKSLHYCIDDAMR